MFPPRATSTFYSGKFPPTAPPTTTLSSAPSRTTKPRTSPSIANLLRVPPRPLRRRPLPRRRNLESPGGQKQCNSACGCVPPPGNSYEYERKGLTEFAFRKLLILKEMGFGEQNRGSAERSLD